LTVYADTSFLVSLYLTDRHSVEARSRVTSGTSLFFSPLHRAEWAHAIAQHVFRGEITLRESDEVYDQLARDRISGLWNDVAVPEHAYDLCADLARVHCPKLGVKTIDTLHVACALELKTDRFWTFDERQGKLAKAQGMKIG
jgi:predicted nucleic acid-binding protein